MRTVKIESRDHYKNAVYPSPFDYPRQALLYLPRDMPEPRSPDFQGCVHACVEAVVGASAGRAFALFTSHAALRRAREELAPRLAFPVLVQGEAPKHELLAQFREAGDAVLIGTSSFWEGVDVRGAALSCVIIDKLPFAAPGDPVLQARLDALREQGHDPFRDYQLPQAVITLKQGVGRLIRDAADTGVLVLCDPRLTSRGYGRVFIASLPDMPVTHAFTDVADFFREHT